MQSIAAQNSEYLHSISSERTVLNPPDEYIIPVVVHIIHEGGPENISDQRVYDALSILNNGFSGLYDPNQFDTKIRFQLAVSDPNGCPTNGIDRVYASPAPMGSSINAATDLALKNLSRWPSNNYLNIWVVKCIESTTNPGSCPPQIPLQGILAYAPFPLNEIYDGIVIRYDVFGLANSTYKHTLAHEVGHYLNLFHIWGPDDASDNSVWCHDNGNNLILGDQVDDTAPQTPTFGNLPDCDPNHFNTCNLDVPDLPNDIFNFMGYHFNCQSRFTPHQASIKMHPTLNGIRSNLWNSVNLDCAGLQNLFDREVEISANTTWTTSNLPNGGEITMNKLTVKSGYTLTISAGVIIHFQNFCKGGSNLIIEPGAKLILKGKLTNSICTPTDYWSGVEVAGPDIPNSLPAGILQADEFSIIENAEIGARNWATLKTGRTYYGGSMFCASMTFSNNHIGVQFFNPDKPLPFTSISINTTSEFGDCKFLYNINTYLPTLPPFHSFMHLVNIEGIQIFYPEFKSTSNTDGNWPDAGIGIYSLGAGFTLTGDNNDNTKEFFGLWKGIESSSLIINRPFAIRKCFFEQCNTGIHSEGISLNTMLFNKFKLGSRPNPNVFPAEDQIGILLAENISGMTIEENEFRDNFQGAFDIENTVGICANNLGGFTQSIRRNKFYNVNMGNIANQVNHDGGFGGLKYECNTNEGVRDYDFAVTDGGIRQIQGEPVGIGGFRASGNTFSYGAPPSEDDFLNNGSDVTYCYYQLGANQEPLEVTPFKVTKQISAINPCTQTYFTNSAPPREQWETDYTAIKSNYTIQQQQYLSSLDNGNTEGLLSSLVALTSTGVSTMMTTLGNISPWLSAKVLKGVVERRDIIPHNNITALLTQNPDVLRTVSFMAYLEGTAAFTATEIQSLKTSASSTTTRTGMEGTLAAYRSELDYLGSAYLSDYVSDDEPYGYEEYIEWMSDFGYYHTDILVAGELMRNGYYTEALDMLDAMPSQYDLAGSELADHSYYKQLVQITINAYLDERSDFDLDSAELAQVQNIHSNTQGIAKTASKNILKAHGFNTVSPVCGLPSTAARPTGNKLRMISHKIMPQGKVLCSPNPAGDFAQFDLSAVRPALVEGRIVISDALGRVVLTSKLPVAEKAMVVDTRQWSEGLYFYNLRSVNGFAFSGKFVVKK